MKKLHPAHRRLILLLALVMVLSAVIPIMVVSGKERPNDPAASSLGGAEVRQLDEAQVEALAVGAGEIEIKTMQIDVTAPVLGASPTQTASVDDRFSVTSVSWSPNDSTFESGKAYTVTLTLEADLLFTFAGIKAANTSINGNKPTILYNDGETLVLSYAFPPLKAYVLPTDREIKTVSLAVMTPVQGVLQDTVVTCEDDSFSVGPVSWTPNEPGGAFIFGAQYTANITLTAGLGYTFAGIKAANIAINGKKATIIANDGATLSISYTFPATKQVVLIDEVKINYTLSSQAVPIPDPVPYADIKFDFWPSMPNPYDVYTLGMNYMITITLTAYDGYSFAGITEEGVSYLEIVSNTGNVLVLTGMSFYVAWM